jgi:hypothetical protein
MDTPLDVDLKKIPRAGVLAVLSAVLAVWAVRVVAFALLPLPSLADFPALGWGPLAVFTAVLTTAAVAVFAIVARRAATPVATYKRIAFGALVLSLVPDLALPLGPMKAPWLAAIVLMVMHVAAWWPTVQILTRLTRRAPVARSL